MGFDNECILNIQSLPGEYFCPVCRTLVYPNEALQSQCTHLYCKPCLAYVVTTTRACPYDGYLVTEADSKPLTESNTSLAETIGKVAVHCLYYRSGCQWQGGLSESIVHCAECNFGTSAVICNRCGTQIMHRQVQEHGLTCPGMQPQAQQTESQAQDSKVQGQAVAPDQSSAASAAPASVAPTTASSAVAATAVTAAPPAPSTTAGATAGQGQIQSGAVLYPQAPVQTPTPEQWYQQQQQYQQYYQQYPGYDPYQQQYQQYAQYQQQVHPQYAQPMQQVVPQQVIPGQQQQPQYLMPQPQVQPQPQAQPLAQLQPHPQTQSHPHPQAQLQPQPQPHPQAQLQPHPQSQPQPQLRPQLPLQPQAQPPHQLQPQAQPQLQTLVPHPQTHGQVIQPHPQHQYPQSQPPQQIQAPVQQLHTAQQPHPHAHPQSHPPPHSQFGGQQPLQPQARPHHPQPQPQQMPPQQVPHAQMQHPQFHAPQQPHPQPHSIPQHQQPHPQPQPFVQPQPQHPSAQAVSGHQSYPQHQLGQQLLPGVPQRPMQVPPQVNPQNQFPQQQTLQMRPPNAQLPMQVQQQSNAIPSQGSHVPMGSGQQQAHHLVPQGQQIHQHPGMQLHAHPQGTHAQHHPGQSLQMHPQQPVHAHGQQYMQQQASVQPTQGMQPPYLQSPATPSKPTHSAVNQQSPNKSYASPAGSQPSTLLEEKTKQSESTDLKIPKSEIDSKSDDNREEATEERKSQKDGTLDESAEQMHKKGLDTNMKDEQTKEHVLKPPVKEDATEPSGKPGQGEGSDVHKDGGRSGQPENIDSQGLRTENVANNMHAPSQHLLQPQNRLHGPQPGSNQERKLPGPPPHPPQVIGQAPMPSQMGPPLRNNPDLFPYQGAPSIPQESFQPQIGKMPHSPYPSEVPHARLAGPGLPPSSGVAPGPMGHHQNYMPPPHGLGPTNFQGQPLGRPGMGGPPSGPGGSAFAMENQMDRSHLGAPGQQAPFGHPQPMPTNGISGIAPHGVPKERFGPGPEESFRPFPEQLKMHREEHFVPSSIDLKRFEEDMKRFPRPDHLDRDGRHPFGPDSRPLPLSRSGGHADFGDRLRPLGHHEDLGRNHDLLRSSVGEYTDSWPGKFGLGNQSHINDFPNRERHGFGDRSKAFPLNSGGFPRSPGSGPLGYFDGPGSLRKDIDGNLTGRHIDIVEPGYGSRHGFPSETKPFNLFSHPGGMDPFEFSRVRKPGSLGLCRICKIDCETVEGLDLHSQTREHQKMAMNMVLSIKQENAKRHKLNSEGNVPFEESSRMRKPSFESHLSWT